MKILWGIFTIFSLYSYAQEITYLQYEAYVKKQFINQCIISASFFAKEACVCAFKKMEKEYFTEENKKSLEEYITKMNHNKASLIEKQSINQFADDVVKTASGYASLCITEELAKAEQRRKAQPKKEVAAKATQQKDQKQETLYTEQIKKILVDHWQEATTTENHNTGKVLIHITQDGIFSYKIISLSYNNQFNTEFKTFLKKMETIKFPPYKNGQFFETQISFKDTDE